VSNWQAFLLGIVAVLAPSLTVVAILVRRAPVLDEDMKPVDEESRGMSCPSVGAADDRTLSDDEHRPVAADRPLH
jgi:hypothetical protein